MSEKVAALFVATGGIYFGRDDVDPWDITRDARKYDGPYPVVAHPPCERWGRYWYGGPSTKVRRVKGDDDGCFASAIAAVRRFGGVLEHPEASHAWAYHSMLRPPFRGGWVEHGGAPGISSMHRAWTCCVEQGHYGHAARKATWLYAVLPSGVSPPSLVWGPSLGRRLDEGFHSKSERQMARAAGIKPRDRLSKVECIATPPAFAELLISIAKGARA